MRVLCVGTLPEPGGAARHLVSLAAALVSAGHQVSVVADPASDIWRSLATTDGIRLYAATFTRRFEASALRTLRQAVRDLTPDWMLSVFERDYWGTALVARQMRIPLAIFLHHAGLKRSSRLTLRFMAHRYVVPSESLRRWVRSLGVAARRIALLHNPVDTSWFRPDATLRASQRAALGLTPDDVLVGYVGRLESNKGVHSFAESLTSAMSRVPALRALWVGFGRREGDVDEIIQRSPHAARHIRRPWTDDMRPYYAAMDILALPSTGPEAFGRVLVEAQSCEIPVLGSEIGGIAETMRADVTGQLVAPADVQAWSDAIAGLALDPARRLAMGTAGRTFVRETFDSRVIAGEFEALFETAHVG